ncbi:MAG: hypothetical protein AB8B55_11115 [Mariniblastus sp.]
MKPSLLYCCAILLAIANSNSIVQAQEQQNSSTTPKLNELAEAIVDIRLKDGSTLTDMKVQSTTDGKLDNSIKSIKVFKPGTKRKTNISSAKIEEIFVGEKPLDVIYDRKNRCLVHSVEKMIDRREHRRNAEERLAKNRDRFWVKLTPEDHERFMKKHREFLKQAQEAMSHIRFRLVETQYFLFFTDLPPTEVDGYIVYLDAMYRELCAAFGLSPERNHWAGKCVVVAFGNKIDFLNFEAKVMKNRDAEGAQGLCHQYSDGTVIFTGFKGDNGFFGHVLVHETAHGFVHRYMTTAGAPSWLNEGMSDWLANVIVKGDQISDRQKQSARTIFRRGGWGNFLTTEQIGGDFYGSASTMVEILLAQDKGGQFKQFFDGIKEGKSGEESLKDVFGLSYQDLQILYTQRMKSLLN